MANISLLFAVLLVAVSADQAFCQNRNDFMNLFGGVMQQAMIRVAQSEWRKLPINEMGCIEQALVQQQGTTVEALIQRGVLPSDPRLGQVRANCRGQIAPQTPQPVAPQTWPYVVDGLALGGQLNLDSPTYHEYQCNPSEQFPSFTWCQKRRQEQHRSGTTFLASSILHNQEGKAVYINREVDPATFEGGGFDKEIDRLSLKYGERPRVMQMPSTHGLDGHAIIARWGKVELERLDAESLSTFASGKNVTQGILVDYLGAFSRSAKLGLPVYRVAGGPGYVWIASSDKTGRGALRFFAANAAEFVSPAKPPSQPVVAQTEPIRVNPAPSLGSRFDDFVRLLEIPTSCAAARQGGRTQLSVRDPFNGRNSPGPVCGYVKECLRTLSAQIGTLVRYLHEHPTLLSELRKQRLQSPAEFATMLQPLNLGARYSDWDVSRLDCNFAYGMVNDNLLPLDNNAFRSKNGFEPFIALAHTFLANLRAEYVPDITKYLEWSPFAPHYDLADEIARTKDKFDAAYNASDIEGFLLLKPDFSRQLLAADSFRAALLRQTTDLIAVEDQLSDLSRRIAQEPISKMVEAGTSDAIAQLRSTVTRLREIAPADRGNVSGEISKFMNDARDIESKIKIASSPPVATISPGPAASKSFPNTQAQDAPLTDCDTYAADPDDLARKAAGVPDGKVNTSIAIPSCEAAVRQYPYDARLIFQLGRSYRETKNYPAAFTQFKRAAEQGHLLAQNELGAMYGNGWGTRRDFTQAIAWYRKAAEQGCAPAQNNLGIVYQNGLGVPRDHTQAIVWYRKAAEQGWAPAQANPGIMLESGEGVSHDFTEASIWFRKAAEQGDEVAKREGSRGRKCSKT
jgi:tetratricopeptide (TPR) repeat protein